jgi:hypothetical protein
MPVRLVDPSGRSPVDRDDYTGHQSISLAWGQQWALVAQRQVDADLSRLAAMGIPNPTLRGLRDAIENCFRNLAHSATGWVAQISPSRSWTGRKRSDYALGLLSGALQVVLEALLGVVIALLLAKNVVGGIVAVVMALIDVIVHFCGHGLSWESLLKYFLRPVQGDLDALAAARPPPPFQRGYVASHLLLGGIILGILTVLLARGGVRLLGALLKEGPAAFAKLTPGTSARPSVSEPPPAPLPAPVEKAWGQVENAAQGSEPAIQGQQGQVVGYLQRLRVGALTTGPVQVEVSTALDGPA